MNGPATGEDTGDDIVAEDWPTFYTQVPVWVLLSGCTAQAYRLYAFLAEHINSRTPGKRIAWPKGTAIARALGLNDHRKAARYWAELDRLGAIRIEEVRYAGGMRRRNRYHVRFNPPPGYTGLLSLSQFYEAHPDVRSQTARTGPDDKSAGRCRGAQKGTAAAAPQGTAGDPREGTTQPHQDQPDPGQPPHAPAARSAPDARRATAGTRADPHSGATAPALSSSPDRKTGRTALTRHQAAAVRTVEAAFPTALTALLPQRRPPALRDAVLDALRWRTPEQLAERAERRWHTWGFASKADVTMGGEGLQHPVGVAVRLIGDGDCAAPRCEDGQDLDTEQPCPRCEERRDARNQRRTTTAPVRHPPTTTRREQPIPIAAHCLDCRLGMIWQTQDGLCAPCRNLRGAPHTPTEESTTSTATAVCTGLSSFPCRRTAVADGLCRRCLTAHLRDEDGPARDSL